MADQFEEEKIDYLPASGYENWLRFSFYCSESKMLKIDLSKTVSMHVISFITVKREKVLFGAFD